MGGSRVIGWIAALASCAAPAAVRAADPPLEMTPASDWSVDAAEGSCGLRRTFEGGADEVGVEIRQLIPDDNFQISVTSGTLSRSAGLLRVRFEPDDDWRTIAGAQIIASNGTQGVLYGDSLLPNADKAATAAAGGAAAVAATVWAEPDRAAREQSITALAVNGLYGRDIRLQTGPMRQPMDSLRQCMDRLLARWGLDPAVQRTLSRPVLPVRRESWAPRVQRAFERGLNPTGQVGAALVRLIVDSDGKPTACLPHEGYDDPGFEQTVCAPFLRHARFAPALDAAGKPVASYHATRVVFFGSY